MPIIDQENTLSLSDREMPFELAIQCCISVAEKLPLSTLTLLSYDLAVFSISPASRVASFASNELAFLSKIPLRRFAFDFVGSVLSLSRGLTRAILTAE